MASYKVLAIFGFILVNIIFVIQSAPVDKAKDGKTLSDREYSLQCEWLIDLSSCSNVSER